LDWAETEVDSMLRHADLPSVVYCGPNAKLEALNEAFAPPSPDPARPACA